MFCALLSVWAAALGIEDVIKPGHDPRPGGAVVTGLIFLLIAAVVLYVGVETVRVGASLRRLLPGSRTKGLQLALLGVVAAPALLPTGWPFVASFGLVLGPLLFIISAAIICSLGVARSSRAAFQGQPLWGRRSR
jgi:hypothetical protein